MVAEECLSCVLVSLVVIVLVVSRLEVLQSLGVLLLVQRRLAQTDVSPGVAAVSLDDLVPVILCLNVTSLIVESECVVNVLSELSLLEYRDIALRTVKDIYLVAVGLNGVGVGHRASLVGGGGLCSEDAHKVAFLVVLEYTSRLEVEHVYQSRGADIQVGQSDVVGLVCDRIPHRSGDITELVLISLGIVPDVVACGVELLYRVGVGIDLGNGVDKAVAVNIEVCVLDRNVSRHTLQLLLGGYRSPDPLGDDRRGNINTVSSVEALEVSASCEQYRTGVYCVYNGINVLCLISQHLLGVEGVCGVERVLRLGVFMHQLKSPCVLYGRLYDPGVVGVGNIYRLTAHLFAFGNEHALRSCKGALASSVGDACVNTLYLVCIKVKTQQSAVLGVRYPQLFPYLVDAHISRVRKNYGSSLADIHLIGRVPESLQLHLLARNGGACCVSTLRGNCVLPGIVVV